MKALHWLVLPSVFSISATHTTLCQTAVTTRHCLFPHHTWFLLPLGWLPQALASPVLTQDLSTESLSMGCSFPALSALMEAGVSTPLETHTLGSGHLHPSSGLWWQWPAPEASQGQNGLCGLALLIYRVGSASTLSALPYPGPCLTLPSSYLPLLPKTRPSGLPDSGSHQEPRVTLPDLPTPATLSPCLGFLSPNT